MNHQQVDVVAFGTHDLCEVDGAEEDEGVETPEIALERRVVSTGEGDDQREEGDDEHALNKARANGFVAHGALDFQFQVLADLSETLQGPELRDVLQVRLLVLGNLVVDEVHLQVAVDEEQHDEANCKDDGRPDEQVIAFHDVFQSVENHVDVTIGEHEERQY